MAYFPESMLQVHSFCKRQKDSLVACDNCYLLMHRETICFSQLLQEYVEEPGHAYLEYLAAMEWEGLGAEHGRRWLSLLTSLQVFYISLNSLLFTSRYSPTPVRYSTESKDLMIHETVIRHLLEILVINSNLMYI